MTNQQHDSRPVCGLCIVTKSIRPRMHEVAPGKWLCPVCKAITVNPTDADKTAKDLAVMFHESTPEEIYERSVRECEVRRRTSLLYRGLTEVKGASKGRTRTKEKPKPVPWYNSTFGRPE